ncbi:hypothetical protein B0T22DRAFT_532627 [Podospora appendiculata]|uniref:Erythromycin biosynthesis protein CIII-like C-terminal domain-containing protein n=1 Tax=Podospora appendiculata TaxID=314037 RepID=A0AAE1CGD6_9PEZI|nr:hypothetical protein B0T22DRAFT_532627 [Podospora appendiculata]
MNLVTIQLNVNRRPVLLFASHPITGHITPTLRVASALASRGWEAWFLGPTTYRSRITDAGVHFTPLLGAADLNDLHYYSVTNPPTPDYWSLTWQQRNTVDFQLTWIDVIPAEWESLKHALGMLRRLSPRRQVIVVAEAMFFGILPLFYDAPLPDGVQKPKTVALSIMLPFIYSADIPPFFADAVISPSGALTESPEDAKERYRRAWVDWEQNTAGLKARMDAKLLEAGATQQVGGPFLSGANYLPHKAILQLGLPGFFLPRSDWPAHLKVVGVLPPAKPPGETWSDLPAWWNDVLHNDTESRQKRVIVVAQGTIEIDPNDLIIPTLRAMAGRGDVIVVAILGRRGAALPVDFALPANGRVTDYLNYDAILPHAHAWVHNGGYGAVQSGLSHGTPMVVAGEGQDKVDNARQVEWSGAGVNLGGPMPRVEQMRRAIETVLDDEGFKERFERLVGERNGLDCFDLVEKELSGLEPDNLSSAALLELIILYKDTCQKTLSSHLNRVGSAMEGTSSQAIDPESGILLTKPPPPLLDRGRTRARDVRLHGAKSEDHYEVAIKPKPVQRRHSMSDSTDKREHRAPTPHPPGLSPPPPHTPIPRSRRVTSRRSNNCSAGTPPSNMRQPIYLLNSRPQEWLGGEPEPRDLSLLKSGICFGDWRITHIRILVWGPFLALGYRIAAEKPLIFEEGVEDELVELARRGINRPNPIYQEDLDLHDEQPVPPLDRQPTPPLDGQPEPPLYDDAGLVGNHFDDAPSSHDGGVSDILSQIRSVGEKESSPTTGSMDSILSVGICRVEFKMTSRINSHDRTNYSGKIRLRLTYNRGLARDPDLRVFDPPVKYTCRWHPWHLIIARNCFVDVTEDNVPWLTYFGSEIFDLAMIKLCDTHVCEDKSCKKWDPRTRNEVGHKASWKCEDNKYPWHICAIGHWEHEIDDLGMDLEDGAPPENRDSSGSSAAHGPPPPLPGIHAVDTSHDAAIETYRSAGENDHRMETEPATSTDENNPAAHQPPSPPLLPGTADTSGHAAVETHFTTEENNDETDAESAASTDDSITGVPPTDPESSLAASADPPAAASVAVVAAAAVGSCSNPTAHNSPSVGDETEANDEDPPASKRGKHNKRNNKKREQKKAKKLMASQQN